MIPSLIQTPLTDIDEKSGTVNGSSEQTQGSPRIFQPRVISLDDTHANGCNDPVIDESLGRRIVE